MSAPGAAMWSILPVRRKVSDWSAWLGVLCCWTKSGVVGEVVVVEVEVIGVVVVLEGGNDDWEGEVGEVWEEVWGGHLARIQGTADEKETLDWDLRQLLSSLAFWAWLGWLKVVVGCLDKHWFTWVTTCCLRYMKKPAHVPSQKNPQKHPSTMACHEYAHFHLLT